MSSQEIDGPALLLLEQETIASQFLSGYNLKFTERDVVRVSALISRLRRQWNNAFVGEL